MKNMSKFTPFAIALAAPFACYADQSNDSGGSQDYLIVHADVSGGSLSTTDIDSSSSGESISGTGVGIGVNGVQWSKNDLLDLSYSSMSLTANGSSTDMQIIKLKYGYIMSGGPFALSIGANLVNFQGGSGYNVFHVGAGFVTHSGLSGFILLGTGSTKSQDGSPSDSIDYDGLDLNYTASLSENLSAFLSYSLDEYSDGSASTRTDISEYRVGLGYKF